LNFSFRTPRSIIESNAIIIAYLPAYFEESRLISIKFGCNMALLVGAAPDILTALTREWTQAELNTQGTEVGLEVSSRNNEVTPRLTFPWL
jgi:hypothetical protein